MEIQKSHKVAAISMINRKLQNIWDAMHLSTLYTVIVLLGHEVSVSIPEIAKEVSRRLGIDNGLLSPLS